MRNRRAPKRETPQNLQQCFGGDTAALEAAILALKTRQGLAIENGKLCHIHVRTKRGGLNG